MLSSLYSEYKFPRPLQTLADTSFSRLHSAYVVVDDSGSMANNDGEIIDCRVKKPSHREDIPRYLELSHDYNLVVRILHHSNVKTHVLFLNKADITINSDADLTEATSRLSQEPYGGTPLCGKLDKIFNEVSANLNEIRQNNQRVLVAISSDGEATDGNLGASFKRFKDANLPVIIAIRICTSEKDIIKYWDRVEKDAELSMDIIDDIKSEAKIVEKKNDWYRYNYPTHILRQCGITIFDKLDEGRANPGTKTDIICKVLGIERALFNKRAVKDANYEIYSIVDKKEKDIIDEGQVFGMFGDKVK